MATVPSTQFTYRSYGNFKLVSGHPDYQPVPDFKDPEGNIKTFQYSKDGSYLGWASPESVKIIDTESTVVINEIPKKNVVEIGFSPKGRYISTWERPVKLADNSVHANLVVWEVATGKELISFTQKSQTNWNVQWTEDESFFSRLVTGEIHFYDSKNPDKGVHSKLRIEGVCDFSLSPGKSSSIAVFIPEKNAAPAAVRIYSITNFNFPLSSKVFYKADKIQMKWNNLGTNLLVLTQTDVDKTNKSYYGETNLYFLSVAGNFDCRVQLDKEGPIHDVAWSPTSKEFIVIYGYMPAKATLFDHRAEPVHEFGINPRNTVKYNPQGRLIFIAGFGNLAGTMDVWDRKALEKIATIEAPNSSESFWSPDGRYIMTATLSPRLRVDNGYKIWHYTGVLAHTKNIQELLQVQWRPANADLYPMRTTLSPPPRTSENSTVSDVKPSPKKVGAYRPPHARGKATPEIFKREDESSKSSSQDHGNNKSTGTTENLSKVAAKNKKKREAAKKKKETSTTVSEDTGETPTTAQSVIISNGTQVDVGVVKTAPAPAPAPESIPDATSSLSENDKKIRNLTKKLRQIEELKERQQSGDKLEVTQLQKIANESSLRKELEMLRL